VKNNFLKDFPWYNELKQYMNGNSSPPYRETNSHIHTPYSFSSFDSMDTIFSMALNENISVLGINDFFVTDGYEAFHNGCLENNIFPLFNIEFIGLLKEEQKKGIRINDPNNPGRVYFCGKGLDFPHNPGLINKWTLQKLKKESQSQIKAMINKLNSLMESIDKSLTISYESVKTKYAKELVRERHLAKAVRQLAIDTYSSPDEQIRFIEALYGGKKSKFSIEDNVLLENEIRSNLLKTGGVAYIEENNNSFPELKKIIKLITSLGGIPCYPVLLDDPSGKFTQFENDTGKLHLALSSMGIGCIELIPGRNELSILKDFVNFFDNKGYLITFGSEHNTPELAPLTITARGSVPLDETLKEIAWNGACVIAAHQYLRAHGRQGYVLTDGKLSIGQKEDLTELGKNVIEYYLNKRN